MREVNGLKKSLHIRTDRLAEAADGGQYSGRYSAGLRAARRSLLYGALLKNEQDVHMLERLSRCAMRETVEREPRCWIDFFSALRKVQVPVTIKELLVLIEALD